MTAERANETTASSARSDVDVDRLQRRLEKLEKDLAELKDNTWGKRVPIAIVTALITLLSTLLATHWTISAKERELAVATASKSGELELESQKHRQQVEQKYLEYTMSEKGGDYEYLERLLVFLSAVETNGQLKAWAASQMEGVKKRQRKAEQDARLAEARAEERALVAEAHEHRAEASANRHASDNERLRREIKDADEVRRRAESTAQDAARKIRALEVPVCKPNTMREEFGRGAASICDEVARSAYREIGKWRWTVLDGEVRRSCVCDAELASL